MFKKILFFILASCICFGTLQCSKKKNSLPTNATPISPRELVAAEVQLIESDNKFGFKLFNEIIKAEKDKNVFISPLSISLALGMTYNGASADTEKAMRETLELGNLTNQEINESYQSLIELLIGLDPKVRFQIANSIWYREGFPFEDDFINLNKMYFNAKVRGLNFDDPNAPSIINQWVNENTNGKIKEIVGETARETVMFLINAIYFKGAWTYKFDEKLTKDDLFTLPDGSKKSCKMMTQEGNFKYFENQDFQAIDLPYGDGKFSMIILLPSLQKNIDSLIAEFNQENWSKWINSFSEHKLTLELPKFTLEYEITLNDILKAQGMRIAFEPYNADFTRMYKEEEISENLYISKVKHKTFVEVNEEGTEAAAVTSVEIGITSLGLFMRVDRPFIFAIREKHSQTILFIGKIINPTRVNNE